MAPFNTTVEYPVSQEPTHLCYQGPDGAFYFQPATVPVTAPINIPVNCAPVESQSDVNDMDAIDEKLKACEISPTVIQQQPSPVMQQPIMQPTMYPIPCMFAMPTPSQGCSPQMSPVQPQCFTVPAMTSPTMTTPPHVMYSNTPPGSLYSPSASVYSSSSPYSTPLGGSTISSRASTPAGTLSSSHSSANESISTRLELVWYGDFKQHFGRYPQHQWHLEPINDPRDVDGDEVHTWQDSAKVRFCCPVCDNCWTSMKGRVIFKYTLDKAIGQGYVWFRLTGQKCMKCDNPSFVHAMWYDDEVRKVVHNLHEKVSNTYYGNVTPRLRIDRRRGQPKAPHPPQSCQACSFGICREEHNFR